MRRLHLLGMLYIVCCIASPARIAAVEPKNDRVPALTSGTPDGLGAGFAGRVAHELEAMTDDPSLSPWQREFVQEVTGGDLTERLAATESGHFSELSGGDGVWSQPMMPIMRCAHTAIYDPVRDRMIVFGGEDPEHRNDVWALSLGATEEWTELTPSGTPPSGREAQSAIYDPVRDRMIVFGGYDGSSLLNDVWALSLGSSPAWTELTPLGTPPSGRRYHTAIYDSARDRMVVFGGYDGANRSDVWALWLGAGPLWMELTPSGTPPSGREAHSAIYDPVRDRMVVFGGNAGSPRNDVWALLFGVGPAWMELTPSGTPPSARYYHTAIYDAERDRTVVFGGVDGSPRNDVWVLSVAGSPQWTQLGPTGTPPSGRSRHTAIYDPVRDRMVVFGGADGSGYRNDVWSFSLEGSSQWTEFMPYGTPPSPRGAQTAIYDPVGDRMVVFGGYGVSYRNDVWALSLGGSPQWTELTPSGTPPSGRNLHTAIYDPLRDRMIVFGGYASDFKNDVWALSLGESPQWTLLVPAGTPPSKRSQHTAIYDPVGDRMVVFGGGAGTTGNDVWALSLGGSLQWTELIPGGTPPGERRRHTAIFHPICGGMIVFGGADDSAFLNDVWALSLVGSPQWTQLIPGGTPPRGRVFHTAVYDPVGDRMVVFGGMIDVAGHGFYQNDVWGLETACTGTGIEPPAEVPSLTDMLHPCYPNPFNPDVTIPFELHQGGDVTLVIYDTLGRLVRTVFAGTLPRGSHKTAWDGRNERGEKVSSGVYFCRLRVGAFSASQKILMLK